MRRRKRLLLVILSVLAVAAGLVLWSLDRQVLLARYDAWRVERAKDLEEARPWLEAMETRFEDAQTCAAVVGLLGEERPRLTCWIFQRLLGPDRLELDASCRFPENMDTMLPLIRELGRRLERNARLREVWAHFVRWRGPKCWYVLDQLSDLPSEPRPKGWLGGSVAPLFQRVREISLREYARMDPKSFEAGVRLVNLCYLGESIVLGMDPLPQLVEPSFVVESTVLGADLTLRSAIVAWLLDRVNDVPQIVRVPETPLPDWVERSPSAATAPAPAAKAVKKKTMPGNLVDDTDPPE